MEESEWWYLKGQERGKRERLEIKESEILRESEGEREVEREEGKRIDSGKITNSDIILIKK